jgi:tetratricopeptide (TPR) repeat protein
MNLPNSQQRAEMLTRIMALRARRENMSADEIAQLGAYLIRVRKTDLRLPDFQEAVQVLEAGHRSHPRHFAILANLGTVYQLLGVSDGAERVLEQAVVLAPPQWQRFEQMHLRLVQSRLREPRRSGPVSLDFLFNRSLREAPIFLDASTPWRVGHLSERDRAMLPEQSLTVATQIVQQLLLWLPEDGRLHWLYGELINAQGQPRAAQEAMTLAVDLFRLSAPELRQRRHLLREYVGWLNLTERLGTPAEQRLWLTRTSGHSLAVVAVGQPWLCLATWDPLAKTPDLLAGLAKARHEAPAEAPPPFDWAQVSWPALAVGGAVVGLFLFLQAREWFRRMAARRSSTVLRKP